MTAIRLRLHEEEFAMDKYQAFYEMVKKWTVSDYRTQAIKSEVIIEMLISDFIEQTSSAGLTAFFA